MQLIKELIIIDKGGKTPIYLQITHAIIQGINQGKLRKGVRLPGARQIADLLEINRLTVVAAFRDLELQGWLEIRPQSGAFVKVDLPTLVPKRLVDRGGGGDRGNGGSGGGGKGGGDRGAIFHLPERPGFTYRDKKILPFYSPDFPPAGKLVLDAGFPDARLAPIEDLVSRIRSLARRSFNKKYLTYGGSQGTSFLRETLATFLNDTRGLAVTPENILITKGAQMGLFISSALLLQPGDEVIVGTPGYARANRSFQLTGAKINYIRMDESGLETDRVERICKMKTVRMVYVIPHHHHPTTVTLSPERRLHLLELAARYRFAIIEDDYDYDFHYASKPMMPMASLDRNGNVIYIGTLSKSLAPAIRVGFMVAPERFIRSATSLRMAIDTQGDGLIENAIAELYKDGTIGRHVKKSVKLYQERRDHFCGLLRTELGERISFKVPEGGMSVWANFLANSLSAVVPKAYKNGLILSDGIDYDTGRIKYNSTTLGFASLNAGEQEKAIAALRKSI